MDRQWSRSMKQMFLSGALLAAGCGGGGGTEALDPTAVGAAAAVPLGTVVPTSFLAAAPQEARVTLTADAVAPEWRLVDERGGVLGPATLSAVLEGRRAARVATPVLPDVNGDTAAFLELSDGRGPWRRLPTRLRFFRLVEGDHALDGTGNNLAHPEWGGAGAAFRREVPAAYADGVALPAGPDRPSARAISNAVCAQAGPMPNARGLSDMFWLWGQFVDHDLDLTLSAALAERFDVAVPTGDPFFDPAATGTQVIPLTRSAYDPASGLSMDAPRQQVSAITAWMDGSQVYGSDVATARGLRTLDGTGRLRTSAGDLLPLDATGQFVAGDIRVNEQVALAAMHVVWLREHNRLADEIRRGNPDLVDDEIYAAARRWVVAELQVVTYREFLPLLLGPDAFAPYRGYDATVEPTVGNLFAAASYRFGHSMVSGRIARVDAQGNEIPEGHLSLRDAFFQTQRLVTEGGVDPVLRGLARQRAQTLDPFLVDDLRNFLFGPPGSGGLDLASLNMQRGRDHGLPGYAACRAALGLPAPTDFEDVSSDPTVVARLRSVYASVNQVDPWLGGLAEDPVPGGVVGPLVRRVLADQFRRARDGDRFWYEHVFGGAALDALARTRLADVIRRNTGVRAEIRDDAFFVPGAAVPPPPRDRPEDPRADDVLAGR